MEKICKNCIYWRLPNNDEYWAGDNCAMPRNPTSSEWETVTDESQQRALFGYATKYCRSPKLVFFQRPDKTGTCVADGSEYKASLITGEGFGCINWTPSELNQ